MLCKVHTTIILLVVLGLENGSGQFLDERVKWTGGIFEWPCPISKNIFKNSGKYIPKNVIATRAAIHNDDAIVALPR